MTEGTTQPNSPTITWRTSCPRGQLPVSPSPLPHLDVCAQLLVLLQHLAGVGRQHHLLLDVADAFVDAVGDVVQGRGWCAWM